MANEPGWSKDPHAPIPFKYQKMLEQVEDLRAVVSSGKMSKRAFREEVSLRCGVGGHSGNVLFQIIRRDTPRIVRSVGGQVHLVVGDAHAAPGQNLERFSLLGRMVRDLRPDVVVVIGDWADMPALSHYDKGKKSFEGRRYTEDIKASNEALRLFHEGLGEETPRLVYCEGNHEHRIERAANDSPGLDMMGLHDLDFERRGWEIYRFKTPATIDGVNYCHYFTSQNTDRAISGVTAGRSLVNKKHMTCVVGHSHLLNHFTTTAGDRRLHGLVVGWFCDVFKDYAGQSNTGWWAGICVLRDVKDGDFDLELWSMARIKKTWSALD